MALCVFRVLNLHASVTGPLHVLDELRVLFPSFAYQLPSGAPITTTSLVVTWDSEEQLWKVMRDGIARYSVPDGSLLAHLEWMINLAAVTNLRSRYLLLHAGAVAYRGFGMLLCAASGSGKSTLTAGLVANGFQYLSDEIAVINPEDLMMIPYPRSICVKDGSRSILMPHYRQLTRTDARHRFGGEAVWFLQPSIDLWRTDPVPVRYLVFPSYIEGAQTELAELSRSSAVKYLIEQSFTGNSLGAQSIGTIVQLLREADCFTFTTGDLQEAVATLRSLARA